VLFAEDARDFRELVRDGLQDRGFAVTAVEDGVRAVEAFRWSTFDLVLTDLAMPDMSGWDVVRAVRSRWPHVRVGLVTGTPQYLEEQQEVVDVLVLKPVVLDTLRRAIAGLT